MLLIIQISKLSAYALGVSENTRYREFSVLGRGSQTSCLDVYVPFCDCRLLFGGFVFRVIFSYCSY